MKELIAYLVATSGLPETEIAPLVTKEGKIVDDLAPAIAKLQTAFQNKLTAIDTAHATALKEREDNFHGKGLSEGTAKVEAAVRSIYGLDTKLAGDALLAKLRETKGTPPKELTPDDILRHPAHIDEVTRLQTAHATALSTKEQEFTAFKGQVEKQQKFGTVWQQAEALIDKLPSGMASDPALRTAQKQLLRKEIEAGAYEPQMAADGSPRIVVLDGQAPKKDANGNLVSFEAEVTGVVQRFFGLNTTGEKGSPGGGAGGDAGGAGAGGGGGAATYKPEDKQWVGAVPKTAAELDRILLDRSLPAAVRMDASAQFEKAQGATS